MYTELKSNARANDNGKTEFKMTWLLVRKYSLVLSSMCMTLSACAVTELDTLDSIEMKTYENEEPTLNHMENVTGPEGLMASDTENTSYAGDGSRGGYELVSALIPEGCMSYKIGPRAFVTTALCLEQCLYESCDIAVITSGVNPVYLGLSTKVVVSPLINNEPLIDGDLDHGIGIVYLDRETRDTKTWSIAPLNSDQLSLYGEVHSALGVTNGIGELGILADGCTSATSALLDEYRSIVGLSLGRQGRCDQFLYLDDHHHFIELALSPNYTQPMQNRPQTDEPMEPFQDSEDQISWADSEAEALYRAPACDGQGESYCDGNIEMSCSGTTYRALHCGRVGWTCRETSQWGGSCEP